MERKMKISEVAALLGVSTDAVRFYEKKNIIHPGRNDNNRYRDFTQDDLTRLFDCKHLQNVGFSLSEIAEIITDTAPEDYDRMLEQKSRELEQTYARYGRMLEQLHRLTTAQQLYERYIGRYYIRNSPHILICPYDRGEGVSLDRVSTEFYEQVSVQHNMFRRCLVIPQEEAAGDGEFAAAMPGYSIEIDRARELGLAAEGGISEWEPRRSVYTTVRVAAKPGPADLAPAFDWMRSHGFALCGDVLCWTLKIEFNHGRDFRTYSLWFPIE